MEDYYESDKGITEYLLFHYGNAGDIFDFDAFHFPEFTKYPTRCIEHCYAELKQPEGTTSAVSPTGKRALDLGCAVGASTFELCRYHDEVIGIDYSHGFIRTANALKESGHVRCSIAVEGNQKKDFLAKVDESIDKSKAQFLQGDAGQLDTSIGQFDTIFAGNLIDRLPKPKHFLQSLAQFCKKGGIVIITSPYTWLEEYSPESEWICKEGNPHVDTFTGLRQELEPHFELIENKNLPFVLREHRRKFQLTFAHATIWRKLK